MEPIPLASLLFSIKEARFIFAFFDYDRFGKPILGCAAMWMNEKLKESESQFERRSKPPGANQQRQAPSVF